MFLSDLTNGRTLHKWDLGAEQRLLAQRGLSAQPNFNPPLVHQLRIVSSRYALAALGSGEVASYDLQTGKSVFRLPAHFNAATSLFVAFCSHVSSHLHQVCCAIPPLLFLCRFWRCGSSRGPLLLQVAASLYTGR